VGPSSLDVLNRGSHISNQALYAFKLIARDFLVSLKAKVMKKQKLFSFEVTIYMLKLMNI